MAVPPSFGDLGKSARDLFEKEYGEFTIRINFYESLFPSWLFNVLCSKFKSVGLSLLYLCDYGMSQSATCDNYLVWEMTIPVYVHTWSAS